MYLNDVIGFSMNQEKHLEDLYTILDLLGGAAQDIMLKEGILFTENVDYIDHVMAPGKIPTEVQSTKTIRQAEFTNNPT